MVNSTLFIFFFLLTVKNFPSFFSYFFQPDGSFNEEIFTISGVKTKLDVPLFKLESFEGEPLRGHYYAFELSRVRGDPLYRIESILERRGKKSLVKFSGYKKPEWIDSENIQNLS